MEIYLDLLRRVMADGIDRGDRTGPVPAASSATR